VKILFTCPSRLVSLATFFSLSLSGVLVVCFVVSIACGSDRGACFLLFCCCRSLIKSRLLLLPFFVVSITELIKLLLFSCSLFFFRLKFRKLLAKSFLAWLSFFLVWKRRHWKLCFVSSPFSFFLICRSVKAAVGARERERERERASEFFLQNSSFLSPASVRHSELSF